MEIKTRIIIFVSDYKKEEISDEENHVGV